MIIDSHCHAGPGDLMTAPWNTNAPIEPYLRRARAAGIDRTIVVPAFNSDYHKANTHLGHIASKYTPSLIAIAFLHARRDAGRICNMVRHAVQEWGFRGIKVHGHDAMLTREICDTARTLCLPI